MGFNMSWIFVDEIAEDALYHALDFVPTAGTPDQYDLGTSVVPFASAALKSGWCAVFAKYGLVMDATVGKNPVRLTRLPPKSRCITCVVLEHAMVSYASLWQDGRMVWEIRHDGSEGHPHLDARGSLPVAFAEYRDLAMNKERSKGEHGKFNKLSVDYVFDVPIDTAASITGYRHDGVVENGVFTSLHTLAPASGNVLTRLSNPPGWWQTVGSMHYE